MTASPVTADPSETVAEAAARMRDRGVGSVVVVADGDRCIGILTERDLIRFSAVGGDSAGTKVSEWMTSDPDTVSPDTNAIAAWDSLRAHGYRHIPVVDAGTLAGIVSMRDLVEVARVQPVTQPGHLEAPKGLEGVIVADTTVGD